MRTMSLQELQCLISSQLNVPPKLGHSTLRNNAKKIGFKIIDAHARAEL
jgi:hypothetical protein